MYADSSKWCSLRGFVLSLVSLLSLTLALEVEDMPDVVEVGRSYDIKWKGGSAVVNTHLLVKPFADITIARLGYL